MKILALRGDGIGPEIVDATIKVLTTISQKFNFNLDLIYSDIGFSSLKKNKTTFITHEFAANGGYRLCKNTHQWF